MLSFFPNINVCVCVGGGGYNDVVYTWKVLLSDVSKSVKIKVCYQLWKKKWTILETVS